MASNRITEETWRQVDKAYEDWDPNEPDSPSISDLLEPYGVSKQAFYSYRRRTGKFLKNSHSWHPPDRPAVSDDSKPVVDALLASLVDARIRIKQLELALQEAGVPIP
jgi:hypothetical protein